MSFLKCQQSGNPGLHVYLLVTGFIQPIPLLQAQVRLQMAMATARRRPLQPLQRAAAAALQALLVCIVPFQLNTRLLRVARFKPRTSSNKCWDMDQTFMLMMPSADIACRCSRQQLKLKRGVSNSLRTLGPALNPKSMACTTWT